MIHLKIEKKRSKIKCYENNVKTYMGLLLFVFMK